MKAAVFLDKDGTLLEDVPYNVNPERMRLAPTAEQALGLLGEHGYELVVVSNQSGVARGLFPESALGEVHDRLRVFFEAAGARLAGFYYCPHHPRGAVAAYARPCGCRKPADGLLREAADELGLDLRRSWMVGDILDDVEAGRRAGCRSVLLDNGHETEWRWSPLRRPNLAVPNLEAAARAIVGARVEAVHS